MPTPTLPDPTVLARSALLAETAVTTLVSTRIYYAIPASPTYPLLVLTLVDDDELRPETLTARVQVDVWGDGPGTQSVLEAKAIAATVRSVARDLKGTYTGGTISSSVAGQVIPQPDGTTGRARFIVDLLIECNA